MLKLIGNELKHHAPFTALGAVSGIAIMLIILFGNILPQVSQVSHTVFYILHPLHITLSAIVTTAMYKKHGNGKIWVIILIGYFGSIGIGTLSDSVIPYLGEILLDLPNRGIHIGFIEEWQIVNSATTALRACTTEHLGIIIPHHHGTGGNSRPGHIYGHLPVFIPRCLDSLLHKRHRLPPAIH